MFLRRTEISDAPGIAGLINADSNTAEIFGDINIVSAIEKAVLAITVLDSNGEIIGHASLSDSPSVPGVSAKSWPQWLSSTFDAPKVGPMNSLSLSLFVVSPNRTDEITTELLRTVFVATPTTENCLLVLPQNVQGSLGELEKHFEALPIKDGVQIDSHGVSVCKHSTLCPNLYVRQAEPEDFDELLPIFNSQSDVLASQYGAHEFFLAELIEAQNELQKCIVAVVDGRAVGLMSLSSDVDVTVLRNCFDLGAYDGLEKSIAIGLFCVAPAHASRSLDFMAKAFELYPGENYCVITMPQSVAEIPLLQNFTKASPSPNSTLNHELWVMHRHALLVNLEVRPYTGADRDATASLVETIEDGDQILADLDLAAAGVQTEGMPEAYVTTSVGTVVGVVVLRSAQEEAPQFRAHYNIEEYILYLQHRTFEHAHLNHFCLNPIFERHSKFILREAMRLSGNSCIYYRVYAEEDKSAGDGQMLPYSKVSVIDSMVPVRHRRQIDYPMDVLMSNVPSSRIRESRPAAALLFLNRKLMLEPKIPINLRIVVIGDSDTSLAFLETLIMKPHLRFANLSIVAATASQTTGYRPIEGAAAAKSCLSNSSQWSSDDKKKVAWHTWVSHVDDRLAEIDRDNQLLKLESGAQIAYDYVVLAPGLEYNSFNAPETPIAAPPVQVETINNADDAAVFLSWVRNCFMSMKYPVIVYGRTLDALTTVGSLLESAVPGSRIFLALPPTGASFPTEDVADIVLKKLRESGVEVRDNLTLVDWGSDGDELERANFKDAEGKPVTVLCDAFLCFHQKSVRPEDFDAVNNCHLVFDSRLVVDNKFRTNDPKILAAGSFTKFSRRYHVDPASQLALNQNEAEVGRALASTLLNEIDPVAGGSLDIGEKALPAIQAPKIETARLPGGLEYLYAGNAAPVSRRLVTRNDSQDKYFSLVIGETQSVVEICAVGPAGSFSIPNLKCLYGLHEQLLSKVVARFDEGLIEDFFDYFRQAWTTALYHDRFSEYMTEITERVGQNPSVDVKRLEDISIKLGQLRTATIEDDFKHEKDAKMYAEAVECVKNDGVAALVKNRLMDFLTYNSYHLPMYTRPAQW